LKIEPEGGVLPVRITWSWTQLGVVLGAGVVTAATIGIVFAVTRRKR